MDIIQQKFVNDILKDEGRRFVRNQGFAIRKELNFHTGKTYANRSFRVSNFSLHLEMPIHVRFLDARKNTLNRRGEGSVVSKKGFRIYNRFKEGHKISIATRLATEYTQEIIQDIKNKLSI